MTKEQARDLKEEDKKPNEKWKCGCKPNWFGNIKCHEINCHYAGNIIKISNQ